MLDRCNTYGQVGLWMRPAYMQGFQNRTITAVVRAGDRIAEADFKTLQLGVSYPVRFIQKPDSGHDVPAVLYPDDGTTVRITGRFAKAIGELAGDDFCGMPPDAANPQLVRYHLAMINNTPLPSFEDRVTIWRFQYCPNAVE